MCQSDYTRTSPSISRLLAILVWLILPIFLVSCSSGGGNSSSKLSVLPVAESFAEQVNDRFVGDLTLTSRINLLAAENYTLDYAKAGHEIAWRDEFRVLRGSLSASQIFQVGSMYCRGFTHTRRDISPPMLSLKGTVCRHEGEEWQLVR